MFLEELDVNQKLHILYVTKFQMGRTPHLFRRHHGKRISPHPLEKQSRAFPMSAFRARRDCAVVARGYGLQ